LTEFIDVSLGFMNGAFIENDVRAATFELNLTGSYASFVLAYYNNVYTKGAKVELVVTNGTVFARQLSARYGDGNLIPSFAYEKLNRTMGTGSSGYGVKSFSLMKQGSRPVPTAAPTSGNVFYEYNAALDARLYLSTTPQQLPGLRALTNATVVSVVFCGASVVLCKSASVTEVNRTTSSLSFVAGIRDTQFDKRTLVQLTVTNATVSARQTSARYGEINTTSLSSPYSTLRFPARASASDYGILAFTLEVPVSATSPPTPMPTPQPATPLPTPMTSRMLTLPTLPTATTTATTTQPPTTTPTTTTATETTSSSAPSSATTISNSLTIDGTTAINRTATTTIDRDLVTNTTQTPVAEQTMARQSEAASNTAIIAGGAAGVFVAVVAIVLLSVAIRCAWKNRRRIESASTQQITADTAMQARDSSVSTIGRDSDVIVSLSRTQSARANYGILPANKPTSHYVDSGITASGHASNYDSLTAVEVGEGN
jgi:hypothetical protein